MTARIADFVGKPELGGKLGIRRCDLLKEEAQATHTGHQVAPSASKLPLWENENPGVFFIEDTVSVQSHEEIKFARFNTRRSQKQGGTMTQEKCSPRSQVMTVRRVEITNETQVAIPVSTLWVCVGLAYSKMGRNWEKQEALIMPVQRP